jgi:hypothetical protein
LVLLVVKMWLQSVYVRYLLCSTTSAQTPPPGPCDDASAAAATDPGSPLRPVSEGGALAAPAPPLSRVGRVPSFSRDDFPTPPPPSALLTRADYSHDSSSPVSPHHDGTSVQSGLLVFLHMKLTI